jgi:Cft2 family RNA processing exonuclease
MAEGRPKLTAVSGVGGKGPACFLVEARGKRLLLDLGYGPQPGVVPNVDGVGKIDALLLSHGHRDHAGSLSLRSKIGNPPVYATGIVAARLPPDAAANPLPLQGSTEVLGIPIRTGRNGHAPGGIWLHLDVGDGLIYMGDYSLESLLYAFDPPPGTGTVIVDGSYGSYDVALSECQKALEPLVRSGPILLPVPDNGRGPEMALWLARSVDAPISLDDAMRASLRRLADGENASVRDGLRSELAALADGAKAIGEPRGIMLATSADGTSGTVAELLPRWERGPEPQVVFTGYVPPGTPAERLVKSGRGRSTRWNVHPRLRDTAEVVRAVAARTIVPAFCDPSHMPALTAALAPARVTMDLPVEL